jgi:predicted phosphodiesterase
VGARFVRGNHDDALRFGYRPRPVRCAPDLLQWTREQPAMISTLVHGQRLLIFHATPWQELDYIFPDSEAFKRLGDQDADLIIYGHTHYRHVGSAGATRVVNVGSTGQPRDPRYPRTDSCAILDLPSGDVEMIEFPDPVLARGDLL